MAEIRRLYTSEILATGDTICHAAESHKTNLSDADLSEANLTGACLRGACLRGACLRGAHLSEADLSDANLRGADLSDADLSDADLSGADLRGADLSGASLSEDKIGPYIIPTVPEIDRAILAEINISGNALKMNAYHTCETTHCRAGWAVHLAGKPGYELESRIGSCAAAALIYAASRPGLPVPNFYASNTEALIDLEACAAQA